jgi:uncharacterized protein (DUF58 family)
MLRKALFHNFHLVYRFDGWLRARFTPAGRIALGALVASGVFGVNTRATLAYQVSTLVLGLLVVAIASAPLFRGRFDVRRRLPRYATVGQTLSYPVTVTSRGRFAQRGLSLIERLDRHPPDAHEFTRMREPEDARRNWFDRHVGYPRWAALMRRRHGARVLPSELPDLVTGRVVTVEARLTPVRRGRVMLDGLWVVRADPLGLFNARIAVGAREHLLVLPRRYPVSWSELLGGSRDRPGGMSQAASIGGDDEFASLREYRPGDPLRHIDWKRWARLGTPIVKEFHEQCFVRQALVLDTWVPRDGTRAQFEAAVSLAASFTCAASVGQGALDVVVAGTRVLQVASGRGAGTIEGVLEALACVEPATRGGVEALADTVLGLAGNLSACVCVLCDWDDARQNLVAALRGLGLPVLVVLASAAPPDDDPDPGPMRDAPGRFVVVRPGTIERDLAGLGAVSAGRGPSLGAAA